MDKYKCAFCGDELPLHLEERTVVIRVEREYDGASVFFEYWAHERCTPQELLTDG